MMTKTCLIRGNVRNSIPKDLVNFVYEILKDMNLAEGKLIWLKWKWQEFWLLDRKPHRINLLREIISIEYLTQYFVSRSWKMHQNTQKTFWGEEKFIIKSAKQHLEFWHFPPIFVLLKLTCLVTLSDRKLQVFKNSPKWTIFGIFN